jgi:hypothetical protein
MRNKYLMFLGLFLLIIQWNIQATNKSYFVISPNGKTVVNFIVTDESIQYSVQKNGKKIINYSVWVS